MQIRAHRTQNTLKPGHTSKTGCMHTCAIIRMHESNIESASSFLSCLLRDCYLLPHVPQFYSCTTRQRCLHRLSRVSGAYAGERSACVCDRASQGHRDGLSGQIQPNSYVARVMWFSTYMRRTLSSIFDHTGNTSPDVSATTHSNSTAKGRRERAIAAIRSHELCGNVKVALRKVQFR